MIKIIGNATNFQVVKKLLTMHLMTGEKIRHALHEIGQENVNYVEQLMRERKTGRVYIINGAEHQASAPGEAPAIRSGELIRSLFYEVSGRQLTFGADTKYAAFLEDGTTRMDPRPYLIRAALDTERDTYNSFVKYGLQAIRQ